MGQKHLIDFDRYLRNSKNLEGVLDKALDRTRRRPGYAGAAPAAQPDPELRGAGTEAWGERRTDEAPAPV